MLFRSSTLLLGTCAASGSSELVQIGGVVMTIAEYLLAFLLSANALSLFSHMRRIQEMERKLNLVLTHLGIDPSMRLAPSTHVMNLAADPRQRIEAIKAYREQTGASLNVAVAVIDEIGAKTNGKGT